MDPISAVLALLGLGYCLGTIRKASSRLPVVVFAVIAIGTALLSPYPYVPITRMSAMLIPLALTAGMAAAYFFRSGIPSIGVDKAKLRGVAAMMALALLGTAVLALNAWQFWVATPKVFHHTQEAVAIGAMRSDACGGDAAQVVMVGRSTIPLLKPALESYRPDGDMPYLLDHSDIQAGMLLPAEPLRCVVFLNPGEPEIQPFKRELTNRYPVGEFREFLNPASTTLVEIFVADAR